MHQVGDNHLVHHEVRAIVGSYELSNRTESSVAVLPSRSLAVRVWGWSEMHDFGPGGCSKANLSSVSG